MSATTVLVYPSPRDDDDGEGPQWLEPPQRKDDVRHEKIGHRENQEGVSSHGFVPLAYSRFFVLGQCYSPSLSRTGAFMPRVAHGTGLADTAVRRPPSLVVLRPVVEGRLMANACTSRCFAGDEQ